MKLKLVALDFASKKDNGVYYYAQCDNCDEHFFYKTSSILRVIWDLPNFEENFKQHQRDCVYSEVDALLRSI